jgi:hypothetical protein
MRVAELEQAGWGAEKAFIGLECELRWSAAGGDRPSYGEFVSLSPAFGIVQAET